MEFSTGVYISGVWQIYRYLVRKFSMNQHLDEFSLRVLEDGEEFLREQFEKTNKMAHSDSLVSSVTEGWPLLVIPGMDDLFLSFF